MSRPRSWVQSGFDFPADPLSQVDPASLDEEGRRVFDVLPVGKANAAKVPAMADRLGMSVRQFRGVTARLVKDHGVPIGTSNQKPFGNYLIDSSSDLDSTVKSLTSGAMELLKRAAALRKCTEAALIAEIQTELLS